jgi:peptide/nickel transport system substrate-binding protein
MLFQGFRRYLSLSLVIRTCAAIVIGTGLVAPSLAADNSQTIRVGVPDLPPGQGNPYSALGTPSIYTWAAIFDSLTLVDAKGVAQPALAVKWENTSPKTWRFTLRDGVSFSNGEKLSPAAVLTGFNFIKSGKAGRSPIVRELGGVASASASGANTVDFVTKRPDPIFPNRIASLKIVAPQHWAAKGPKGYAADPVGTGAYKVVSWKANKIKLAAFEGSWRAPKAGNLEIIELPERSARVQALMSGQIDIAAGLSTDNIPSLEGAGHHADVRAAPQVMALALPVVRKDKKTKKLVALNTPFSDVRVRQALNYAVDKEGIAKGVLAGFAKAAGQGATPAAFGYNPAVKPYPYDPAKARKLLADAGHADGLSFTAEVVTGAFPGDSEIYQKMAQDMSKAGIKVTLQKITFPEWLGKYLGRKPWDGQAFALSWNSAPYVDSIRPIGLYSCFNPFTFTCDEKVKGMIIKANSEFDRDKRRAVLHQIHVANHDNPPAVFLIEQIDVFGLSKRLKGFNQINRWATYHEMSVK